MAAPPGPPQRGQIPQIALLALLVALTFLLPVTLMRGKSATFDEVVHLPAGYSYLKTGLFKINPQHPPLIKELCALPLLFLDLKMPVDRQTLATSTIPLTYQWGFGRRFLYSQNADRILFLGRLVAVSLSLGLAVLIALWSLRLWGISGALLAVSLYLLDPTVTAHAQLVTTDVGLAFFATLFLFLLRRYVEDPGRGRLIAAGLSLGLALAAKFSGIILIPMALMLLLVARYRPVTAPSEAKRSKAAPRSSRKKGPAPAPQPVARFSPWTSFLWIFLLAALAVWAVYFFPAD